MPPRTALRTCTLNPARTPIHHFTAPVRTPALLVPHGRQYSQKRMQQIDLTPRPSVSQKKWSQLSTPQKIVRTASTGGNLLTILAGMALTVRCYLLQIKPDGLNTCRTTHDRLILPNSDRAWWSRCSILRCSRQTPKPTGLIEHCLG